jgi:dihydrofolate reductase
MRKLIMKMSMTVDGFAGDPNGENDWVFKTGDEESKAWSVGLIREAGLIIMGRKSFEVMASYWRLRPGLLLRRLTKMKQRFTDRCITKSISEIQCRSDREMVY